MAPQLLPHAQQQLDLFCHQYLQLQLDLDYPDGDLLPQDNFQQAIYSRIFAEDALKHAPPHRYQLRVLKALTQRIEESIQDWDEEGISDDLINSLSTLFSIPTPSEYTSAQTKSYVTYTLSSLPPQTATPRSSTDPDFQQRQQQKQAPTITLLESRNLLAASGTTGLRTWEAALHLGQYLCQHPDLIQGRSILELGTGTGYLSILCASHLHASRVLATDGSEDVVSALSENLYLNALQDSALIEGRGLTWGHALVGGEEADWNAGREIDVILGADLTYDGAAVPALVGTFVDVMDMWPRVQVLIAATVRNEETFQNVLGVCAANGLRVEILPFEAQRREDQRGPFYEHAELIRLCSITRVEGVRGGISK